MNTGEPAGIRTQDTRSAAEVHATVEDYLAMLDEELAERPYSKADHRRRLLPRLDGRTESAIEFKHQNISTVMERWACRASGVPAGPEHPA